MDIDQSPTSKPQLRVNPDVPASSGVGFKPEHFEEIIRELPPVGWFEIHAENYMGQGGMPHHMLARIRENYPLSLHGVGLSIGASQPLDLAHLARLKAVADRYEPGLFSEHLAWSTHQDTYYPDLLPVPYNEDTLERVADHIDQVQEVMDRRMLLENPSTYLSFETSTMSEIDFLNQLVKRTGCGLLLDVNNIFVSATNQGYDALAYVDALNLEPVGEIHLAGHAEDQDNVGDLVLIDSHDREVADPVWDLYRYVISKVGAVPTLIEWDSDVPSWTSLLSEANKAKEVLDARPLLGNGEQELAKTA